MQDPSHRAYWRANKRLIAVLLAIWFAFVSAFAENLYGLLSIFYLLLPLWVVSCLFGLWHLFKTAGHRLLAASMIVAFPAVMLLASALPDRLPLVTGRAGTVIFFAVVCAYPTIWLIRWLWRISAPASSDALAPSYLLRIRVGAVATLISLSLLMLVLVLSGNAYSLFQELSGDRWLGSGLMVFAILILGLVAIAIPYAMQAIRFGHRRSGIALAVFNGLASIALVIGAIGYTLLALMHG